MILRMQVPGCDAQVCVRCLLYMRWQNVSKVRGFSHKRLRRMPGNCTTRDRGQPAQPCIPAAWPNAVCAAETSWCQPTDTTGGMFTCQPAGAVPAFAAVVVEWSGGSAFPDEAPCGPTNCGRTLGAQGDARQVGHPAPCPSRLVTQ